MKKIILENLNKYYHKGTKNEIHVINNTNLEFDEIGLVCLLGESGSGKTTLLNVMSGIDIPQSGKILVDEVNLKCNNKKSEPIKNNKFGYVFQNYYMINDETVYENLRLALAPYHIEQAEIDHRIDYVLEAVEMKRYKKRKINQLSGGQAQRIAIARALIKTPDVIFADEPTGNLDESTTLKIMTILKNISKNCLVIVATHEKRVAEFFADRIINIKDGKVISDRVIHSHNNIYDVVDDHNLYLKDYQKEILENENQKVNFYFQENTQKLEFSIIFEHGKYYIHTNDPNKFEIITPDAHIQAIDDFKPVINMEHVENTSYHLDKPSKTNNGKLAFKDILKKVLSNSHAKSFIIMVIALVLISAISVLAVADYMSISENKVQDVLTTDSRILDIEFNEGSNIKLNEFKDTLKVLYDKIQKDLPNQKITIATEPYAYLLYEGFTEIENMVSNTTTMFNDYSLLPLEFLDEEKIIYGKKPEKINEVVVDRWVLEQFMQEKNIIATSMTKIEAFLGMKFLAHNTAYEFTIVGICESSNKVIYADEYAIFNASYKVTNIASLEYLKSKYPDRFANINLEIDDMMIISNKFDPMRRTRSINGVRFEIIDKVIPNDFDVDAVISEEAYQLVMKESIINASTIRFITDNKDEIINYLNEVFSDESEENIFRKNLQYQIKDIYQDNVNNYNKERNKKIISRLLVEGSIFIMSVVALFITMKSHASYNMQSTMVYRLLGFKKSVVISIYSLEILLISLLVVIPTSLVVVGVLKFIASLPASIFNFALTTPVYFLTIIVLLVVNILVGVLPVTLIMRKTPAQLVSEYDL